MRSVGARADIRRLRSIERARVRAGSVAADWRVSLAPSGRADQQSCETSEDHRCHRPGPSTVPSAQRPRRSGAYRKRLRSIERQRSRVDHPPPRPDDHGPSREGRITIGRTRRQRRSAASEGGKSGGLEVVTANTWRNSPRRQSPETSGDCFGRPTASASYRIADDPTEVRTDSNLASRGHHARVRLEPPRRRPGNSWQRQDGVPGALGSARGTVSC